MSVVFAEFTRSCRRCVMFIGFLMLAASTLADTPSANPPMESLLARRGALILDDDGSKNRGGKKVALLEAGTKVRAGAGVWERSVQQANVWRSTWRPKMGHTPVVSYQGFRARNLVVEVTFRFGEITEPWQHQCFRIAADDRPEVTGHIVSAWANPNNDFIETGFLLQHIRKTPAKIVIEDLLLDQQPISVVPKVWFRATLEIVDDEALFRMGDHVAYAKSDSIRAGKNLVSLTFGNTWHEVKRVRIWHAEPNPDWPVVKEKVLSSRLPFEPVPHSYRKSGKNREE